MGKLARSLSAALACAGLLAACRERPEAGNGAVEGAENSAVAAPATPVTEPPLGREELLIATLRAASAAGSGRVDVAAQRALDGKKFAVAIRFGCGRQQGTQPFGWRVNEADRTLRVSVAPNVALDDPLIAKVLASGGFEAVEGFWLERPWMLSDACPSQPQPTPMPESGQGASHPAGEGLKNEPATDKAAPRAIQRISIARLFTSSDARTGRRSGRPYEAVIALPEGEAAPADGLNLIISGRLRALPDGRVIACALAGPDRPPDCLISAEIGEVRLQRPGDSEVLAEWTR